MEQLDITNWTLKFNETRRTSSRWAAQWCLGVEQAPGHYSLFQVFLWTTSPDSLHTCQCSVTLQSHSSMFPLWYSIIAVWWKNVSCPDSARENDPAAPPFPLSSCSATTAPTIPLSSPVCHFWLNTGFWRGIGCTVLPVLPRLWSSTCPSEEAFVING